MDTGDDRRAYFENFPEQQYFRYPKNSNPMLKGVGIDKAKEKIKHTTEYVVRNNKVKFFVQKWMPLSGDIKGVLFYIHGYGGSTTFSSGLICQNMSLQNYAVLAMDGYGHGCSDGLHCYIESFDLYVDDYKDVYERFAMDFKGKKKFIISLSMGGAVTLSLLLKDEKKVFDGAVLISPMLGLSSDIRPGVVKRKLLAAAAYLMPKAKLTPVKDISDVCFIDEELSVYTKQNKMLYNDTARLGTSNVLVKAIEKLEKLFEEITRPVLLLHGEDDIITSPQMSKALFERCGSQDKTLKLYPKQRHALLFEGVAEQCFADIVAWLDQRAL